MKTLQKISMCALLGLAVSQTACTSRKAAAEAQTAEGFESSAEPTATEPTAAEPTAAEPTAATTEPTPASDSPAGSTAAEDDTWTDEPGDAASTTTATPAAKSNQPETRTMDVIRKFVLERREKVRPCYDKAQAGRPNFKGDVMMRFVLSPSGTVQSIEYSAKESSLYAPDVGECIAREMKTWQFPASSRGMETKVGYPFNFNPRSK